MVGNLLLRGMLVGVFAGLLALGFAKVFGEPQVDRAIVFEEQQSQAAGGLFSLVFAYVYGRASNFGPRGTAALLALAGFVAIVLVPYLKYPANPPAVSNPDTLGVRTELFFIMLVLSVTALAGAVALTRRLSSQYGAWNATVIAGVAFIIVIAIVQYAMPAISEMPEQFSADLLWRFRIAALGIQVVLWTTIGLAFGALVENGFPDVAAGKLIRSR